MHLSPAAQTAILQKAFNGSATEKLLFHSVGGGSINEAYRITYDDKSVFCKINSATKFPHLFTKEKAGLELLEKQGVIKVPSVIDCFELDGRQFLLLEWIHEGEKTEIFWKRFGEQLAALHHITSPTFGLEEDNYMGSVHQRNRQHLQWTKFFIHERLLPMAEKCTEKGLINTGHQHSFEKLAAKLHDFFPEEAPALVHGDLWNGNFMCDQLGNPVLIDPAVYYGHRSVDLAMTTLFGGFRQPFYEAYHYSFPLPPNYREQWVICNLYPLLIHLYLFGRSYLPQIENTLEQFV